MRTWISRGLVGLLAAGLFAFFFVPVHTVTSGTGQTYYSLEGGGSNAPGVMDLSVTTPPPNCSTWHELWPNYCAPAHQDGYADNGDGCVSACDEIVLDGVVYHIVWVGPTYYMTCFEPGLPPVEVIWEPNLGPHDPANPVCEEWEEVFPEFGRIHHIDDWVDADGSMNITPCDEIFSDNILYHIDDIRLNIIIEPVATGTEESTWGWLKRWLSGD